MARGRRWQGFSPGEAPERPADPAVRKANFRRIVALFRPYGRTLLAVNGLILVSATLGVIPSFLLREVLDVAIPDENMGLLTALVAGMIAIPVATGVLGVWQTLLSNRVGQAVMHDLRTAVYRHLQRLSLAFFTRTRTGEVQSRIANDIGGIENVVTSTATSVVSNVTTVLATVVAMLLLDWRLAVFALALLPLFVWLTKRVGERRRRGDRRAAGLARGRLLDRAGVALGLRDPARQDDGPLRRPRRALRRRVLAARRPRGAEPHDRPLDDGRDPDDLRGHARARLLVRRLDDRQRQRDDHDRDARRLHHAPVAPLLPDRLAARRADRGAELARALRPDLRVPRPARGHRGGDAGARRARAATSPSSDVRFRYGGETWTLDDVSFAVPAGTTTALVGETGSGKTTCGYLVARLYDATEGQGDDRRRATSATSPSSRWPPRSASSRRRPTSSTRASRENLRFARPDATDAEVEEAARAAQVHDLIASLPEGYDTVVGERGYRFSGRREAAHRHRAHDPPQPAHPRPRRGHLGARHADRAGRPGGAGAPGRGPDDDRHRPPPLDGPRRRPDRRPRPAAASSRCGTHDELLARGGRYASLVFRDADAPAAALTES